MFYVWPVSLVMFISALSNAGNDLRVMAMSDRALELIPTYVLTWAVGFPLFGCYFIGKGLLCLCSLSAKHATGPRDRLLNFLMGLVGWTFGLAMLGIWNFVFTHSLLATSIWFLLNALVAWRCAGGNQRDDSGVSME